MKVIYILVCPLFDVLIQSYCDVGYVEEITIIALLWQGKSELTITMIAGKLVYLDINIYFIEIYFLS